MRFVILGQMHDVTSLLAIHPHYSRGKGHAELLGLCAVDYGIPQYQAVCLTLIRRLCLVKRRSRAMYCVLWDAPALAASHSRP